jgi:FkbM family methyltransferase
LNTWRDICNRSNSVVDIGAYSGIYSLIASKLGVANVLSVEPNPYSAKRLKMNKFINRASSIRILSQPLGYHSNEELGLYVPKGESEVNGSRFESSGARFIKSDLPEIQLDNQKWTRIFVAKTMKLDDLISQLQNHQRISGIKIDAEGMELSILRGAHQILSRHKPELIIETWSDGSTNKLNEYLAEYGYEPGIQINDENYNVAASNLYFRVNDSEGDK